MKRDMDLLRELVLKVEEDVRPGENKIYTSREFPDRDWRFIEDHFVQLVEHGYIEIVPPKPGIVAVKRMTPAGHDFADLVRDDEIWRKTKEGAKQLKGFSVNLLKDLARGYIKTQIKRLTGEDFEL